MRIANSIAWAALGALAVIVAESSFAAAALINVPALYSCEPADIRVLAKGNYTIEGRDSDSHKLVFRARVDKGVNLVTWDSVDLVANATAIITVTDQTSPKQTALVTASAIVQANPMGNTTCLREEENSRATAKQKNMVATIIGIVLAAFVALVLLLVGGMMYRRKKEKAQKFENESLDLNHGMPHAGVPAGGSYMARLVPGLKLQEARPLPRDPVLESEQANYASTRRGTQYYKHTPDLGGANANPNAMHATTGYYREGSPAPQYPQYGHPNPFASQQDLHYPTSPQHQQHHLMYQNKDYDQSQTSFLSKKSSK